MSYHYRDDKKREALLRELSQVDNDLNSKKKTLERLKLEEEFYEEKDKPIHKDKLSLADQIMNELMLPPQSPYSPLVNAKLQPKPAPSEQVRPVKAVQKDNPARENHFINERQIQKIKMQNQKHEGLFPNSSDHNRVRSFGKQQPPQHIPQQDKVDPKHSPHSINPLKKALSPQVEPSYNPAFNPFLRGEEALKQKREQSQKEYLRELQLQRQEQQRLKEERERQKKMLKGQFHDFLPAKAEPEKPITIKKTDPNSRPPKVQAPLMGNYSQFDTNLIKSKGIEIKSKYKKGKITYEEYQREINNLRKQYSGSLDQLLDNKVERESSNQPIVTPRPPPPAQEPVETIPDPPFSHSLPVKESINYSHLPQPEPLANPTLSYTLPPQPLPYVVPAQVPPEYVELMRKMFEVCLKEVKEVYSQRLVSQDQAYQETLNKFVQYTQNNFMTQQVPPLQASQQQREFFSDAKQMKDFFEKESVKRKVNQPSGESLSYIPNGQDNHSYYEKSLSAIASKIPYLKGEREERGRESEVQAFYGKKYKVKKIEKFAFLSDPKHSNVEIPSTSTYLRNSNALHELEVRFQEDLTQLRKIQSTQNSNRFANRLTQNTAYASERRVLAESKPVGSGQGEARENPFLKKHVSTDENMMTFNEKELRINSPIHGYSPKSKKEILEQDEYQTEPRVREDSKASYIEEYEQRLNAIPNKALNFIAINNEALRKYEQEERKEPIMIQDVSEVRQKESNYFTNNDISPVKRNEHYEESLETIRSDFEPPNSKRPNPQQLNPTSKSKRSLLSRPEEEAHFGEMAGYSQTVESIEESSARNSRPPVAKRRTVSKKKEGSIARSKLNQESSISRGLNQSSLQDEQPLKFDSNVYESHYEQSSYFPNPNPNQQITANARFHTQDKDPNIEIYPPTIVTPKSALEIQPSSSVIEQKPKGGVQSKLKSLEEARKLAKEGRARANDESGEYRSVEERFSELQSFMTRRGEESGVGVMRGKEEGKRDIMRMLEQLQEEEGYKQEFESYRSQSQLYQ